MLCILKRDPSTREISGWIIATDCADARRQALAADERQLAEILSRMEGPLEHTLPSIQDLPINGPRYTMLRA